MQNNPKKRSNAFEKLTKTDKPRLMVVRPSVVGAKSASLDLALSVLSRNYHWIRDSIDRNFLDWKRQYIDLNCLIQQTDLIDIARILKYAKSHGRSALETLGRYSTAVEHLLREEPSPPLSSSDCEILAILGEEFFTAGIIEKFYGTKIIIFDHSESSYGGASALETLLADSNYRLIDRDLKTEVAIFVRSSIGDDLPINFFTIVLNGQPFIRYHETVFCQLPFRWHWHIVEGVAELAHDTSWSLAGGGHIPSDVHDKGKSNDGTSQYLNELALRFPQNVTVYRKGDEQFWDGKLEMVRAPLSNIEDPCLLWQVDADELWRPDQIIKMRDAFRSHPDRTAAWFWCNYYIGDKLGIATRYNYAQNPNQEWLRVWRFEPGMVWAAHEPPILRADIPGKMQSIDVGRQKPFYHDETEEMGIVFDHFAYAIEGQAKFKEAYYGYSGAVTKWKQLQKIDFKSETGFLFLRNYLPWINDETMFYDVEKLGWKPMARYDEAQGEWKWNSLSHISLRASNCESGPILIDGIFFQLNNTGIARLWRNLLLAWVKSGFALNLVMLDRAGSAPRIEGLKYRTIKKCDLSNIAADADYLQSICDQERAALFISTYYTAPLSTPNLFFGYDMIPENFDPNSSDLWWRQKKAAINSAIGHIMISNHGADDLVSFHPQIDRRKVHVSYCSVDPVFCSKSPAEVDRFKSKFGIDQKYILLVGEREGWLGYKNGIIVFAALSMMPSEERPLLLCVGGNQNFSDLESDLLPEKSVKFLWLDDEELCLAYAGAQAYICPSLHEGFGLPVIEAMAVGCPVIAARSSALPEVAGPAAAFFDPYNAKDLSEAIRKFGDADAREAFIKEGFSQIRNYNQDEIASKTADYIELAANNIGLVEFNSKKAALGIYYEMLEAEKISKRIIRADNDLNIAKDLIPKNESVETIPQNQQIAHAENTTIHMSVINVNDAAAEFAGDFESVEISDLLSFNMPGFGPSEGPYPSLSIYSRFRWQTERSIKINFYCVKYSHKVIKLGISNVIPGQTIEIRFKGAVIRSFPLMVTGWDAEYSIDISLELTAGDNNIEITAHKNQFMDGKQYYIAWRSIGIMAVSY